MLRNGHSITRDDVFSVSDAAPAVFGAEYEPNEATEEEPPEVVYVPSEPVDSPQAEVTVQLAPTEDDEPVLLAVSTLERLIGCLGAEQPWLAIPKRQIEAVRQECEARFSRSIWYDRTSSDTGDQIAEKFITSDLSPPDRVRCFRPRVGRWLKR